MPPLLEARQVRKVFHSGGGLFGSRSETVAVDGFSMTINDDEPAFITIAGESGSGKTTIARMLLGVTDATGGQVLYRGQDLVTMNGDQRRAFRQEVQAIFQDPFEVYNPFYKIDHILTTPIEKFGLAASKDEARDKIIEALETVGLHHEDTLGRYPHQLSGGQRQRITIARALLLKPRLIIADEPVSMVDASLRATILESLHKLYRDFNISFLYITHDLTTAYQVSQNIVILYHGSVVEAGHVDQVIKDPKHPYTQELIHSIPVPEPGSQWIEEAVEEKDESEASAITANGCPYAPRCARAMARCQEAKPPLYQTDSGRAAACYLYDSDPVLEGEDLTTVLAAAASEKA
ncbi:MAG: ATP-binding cassette domain-containing protein [Candidatus Latescibacteria bacterium]|nr:ATP-binding cassette domain-containing protein [Candidatus Latescibacterota bacterium]